MSFDMLKLAGYFFSGGRMPFNKTPKTYREQLGIFKSRGLIVPDEDFAEHCLRHHNYYRLSAYRFPFTVPDNVDLFKGGTTFDQLWDLYCFDRNLRLLVMQGVKRLEISTRTNLAYNLAHRHGVFSYEDPSVFKSVSRHSSALQHLDEELSRSKELFVQHYRTSHRLRRPPIWAACEVMSFGLLSRFYENIKFAGTKKCIAAEYGLHPDTMRSLLVHSVYIRNLCAHHSRLWNRKFTITLKLPQRGPAGLINSLNITDDNSNERRKIYNTLVMLAHIVNVIEPGNDWTQNICKLLHEQSFPVAEHMGFPENWQTLPMWSRSYSH